MSALAIAHPHTVHARPRLRPVPDLPAEPPVTLTLSGGGGGGGPAGRDRLLAALRDLVNLAGPEVAVTVDPPPRPSATVRLDPRARTALREGQVLDLSRLEYDLLLFLARHPGQVFSRSQLLAQVWGHTHTTNRTVDVHISRLRTKLDHAEVVTTVYGLGYRLADDAAIVVDED